MHGNSLERLGCCIQAYQAGNHDCRGDTQTLARETNQLNWLLASQLLDLERVTINTTNKDVKALKGVDSVNDSQQWAKGNYGTACENWVAYLTLLSVVLTLSMSAMCWAPSNPS
jgi:hypothetical protein